MGMKSNAPSPAELSNECASAPSGFEREAEYVRMSLSLRTEGANVSDSKVDTFAEDVRASFAGRENVRPEEIAAKLQLANGKAVRGFLRATFPRPVEMKGSTWLLTNEQTLATVEFFLAKRVPNASA